jgi:Domain of unknown function (DUF1981)
MLLRLTLQLLLLPPLLSLLLLQVAMYAIDSLRQLAHKFMAKEELRDFNFQRLFMKPFETVAAQSRRVEIREFVLRCVDNLIAARRDNIRSGWKSIFAVLATAARDSDASITQLAWSMLDGLVTRHMASLTYDFLDLTKCLLAFVEGTRPELSLAAIAHLELCGDYLAASSSSSTTTSSTATSSSSSGAASTDTAASDTSVLVIVPPVPHPHLATRAAPAAAALAATVPAATATASTTAAAATADVGAGAEGSTSVVHLQLWWPLLFGLSENVGSGSEAVRHACLAALSRVLKAHGHLFSTQTWGLLLKGVLAPMMEGAATDVAAQRRRSNLPSDDGAALSQQQQQQQQSAAVVAAVEQGWVAATAPLVLRACVELFFMHGDTTRPLLPEMLALIQSCVCQEGETLARMGLTVLQEFITGLEEREASYLQQQQQQQQQQCKQRVIVRPAAAGAGAGDAFTVWDCLTASLTAMLLDNLPVEVLEGSDTAATDAAAIGSGSGRQLSASELSPQLSPVAPASLRAAYTSTDGAALAAAATAARSVTGSSTFDSSSGSTTTDDIVIVDEDDYDSQHHQQQQESERGEPNLNALMTMLVVGLRLLPLIQGLIVRHSGSGSSGDLSDANLTTLIEAFEASGAACRRFNNSFTVRRSLGRAGFMTRNGQPAAVCQFLQQEMASYAALLQCLAHLSYTSSSTSSSSSDTTTATSNGTSNNSGSSSSDSAAWAAAPLRLGRLCRTVVMGYSARERALKDLLLAGDAPQSEDAALMQEAIDAMTPLVIEALRTMRRLSDGQLTSGKEWVYQSLVGLITCDSADVRAEVHKIFSTRMTGLLGAAPAAAAVTRS